MFKQVFDQGYIDVFVKLGFRLDSGAANQRKILRKKYIDAGHDDATADTYSQSASQKLWKDTHATGGVPGYHKAVSEFQAPKPGTWVSPEETERHMQNPALQAAMLAMAAKRQQKQAAIGQFVKNIAGRAKAIGSGARQGLSASMRENPEAWTAAGGALATAGALGVAGHALSKQKRLKEQQQSMPASAVLPRR